VTSNFDLDVAGRTLCQEARGEPLSGQQAVAHVIKNRLASGRWGRSLSSVCLWRGQFSGWYVPTDPNFAYACGLQDADPTLAKMRVLMREVLAAKSDPTKGATHYVNLSIVATPIWVTGDKKRGIVPATPCGKIGAHSFFKDVK